MIASIDHVIHLLKLLILITTAPLALHILSYQSDNAYNCDVNTVL